MSNKFITLLEQIGSKFRLGAKKALAIEAKALPLEEAVANGIALADPALGVTLQEILTPIAQTEQIATAVAASTGTGKQKLAAALPGVEQAILSDPLFKGKVPADLPKYNTAIEALTGAFADLLNSFAAADQPAQTEPSVVATLTQPA